MIMSIDYGVVHYRDLSLDRMCMTMFYICRSIYIYIYIYNRYIYTIDIYIIYIISEIALNMYLLNHTYNYI